MHGSRSENLPYRMPRSPRLFHQGSGVTGRRSALGRRFLAFIAGTHRAASARDADLGSGHVPRRGAGSGTTVCQDARTVDAPAARAAHYPAPPSRGKRGGLAGRARWHGAASQTRSRVSEDCRAMPTSAAGIGPKFDLQLLEALGEIPAMRYWMPWRTPQVRDSS